MSRMAHVSNRGESLARLCKELVATASPEMTRLPSHSTIPPSNKVVNDPFGFAQTARECAQFETQPDHCGALSSHLAGYPRHSLVGALMTPSVLLCVRPRRWRSTTTARLRASAAPRPSLHPRPEDGGAFALFADGDLTPEVQQMFASGNLNINYRAPDPSASSWCCSSTPTSPRAFTRVEESPAGGQPKTT